MRQFPSKVSLNARDAGTGDGESSRLPARRICGVDALLKHFWTRFGVGSKCMNIRFLAVVLLTTMSSEQARPCEYLGT